MRERHHVWTASHVDLVCLSTEVVRGVIDGHRVSLLKAVAVDVDFVTFSTCEVGRFRIVLLVEDSSEEVICQLWNKVLMSESVRYLLKGCRNKYS